MESNNNVSQVTENEGKVLYNGIVGKVTNTKIIILQTSIPIDQVQKVDVITKRSGWLALGGVALITLPRGILSQFVSTRGYRLPDASIHPMDLVLGYAISILFIIGLYLIVHGIIGTKYLKIFSSNGEIEVKCNRKKERKLFIAAINIAQQDTKREKTTL